MDIALDDAGTDGVPGETVHIVGVQLLDQTLPVFLDRLDADNQRRS
jgi:hypothetical protein